MTAPLSGDKKFRDDVIRIAELTVNTNVIDGYEFSNCRIIGPAVLGLINDVTIAHCHFDAPSLNAVFWEVPDDRGPVIGAVGVKNSTFSNCKFESIGIAGPPDTRRMLEAGFRQ